MYSFLPKTVAALLAFTLWTAISAQPARPVSNNPNAQDSIPSGWRKIDADGKFSFYLPPSMWDTGVRGIENLPHEYSSISPRFVETSKTIFRSIKFPAKQAAACRGKTIPVSLLDYGPKRYGRRIPFLSGGISQRARLVIRDRNEFDQLWKQIAGATNAPPPEVDFSREMLIVAAMGQKPSSGFESIVDSACEVDNQLEVFVRSTDFRNCGLQLGVVIAPVDIVRLPKTDLPVVFQETEVVSDCKELAPEPVAPSPPPGISTCPGKFVKHKKVMPHRYIVMLNDNVVSDKAPIEVRRARITAIAKRHAETYGGKYDYIYETALKGYAIELPNEAAAIAISKLPEVTCVEEDAIGSFGARLRVP